MKGKHRSFLKRVLDAFDAAEETWRERRHVKPSMSKFASPVVQTRSATFADFDTHYVDCNVNCRHAGAWRPLMFTPLAT
jgi:hypothetical protein